MGDVNSLAVGVLFVLVVLRGLLQVVLNAVCRDPGIGNNPQFIKFQRGYFAVYLLAMFADWLQGPYLYKLYSYYGFQEDQIAVLYVFGFASTVLLGTWTPILADQFGRKKLCVAFAVIYSLSCLMKLSRSYGILLIGRLLGGVATSVLFTAFEAWYIHEHIETHDFPKEWISVTFSKASMWNGILATAAGVVANTSYQWMGPVAPYMLAVPFLIFVGILVATHWTENYGAHNIKFGKHCGQGFKKIFSSEKIFMIGVIEALFESVIYIIIFLWTPILDVDNPALGIIFASFMICILIGSAIFHILTAKNFPVTNILIIAGVLGLIANIICIFSTHPKKQLPKVSYIAFIIFELAVGLYFPTMGFLRNNILPGANRSAIMNWFRVPISLIACIVLMLLHEDVFQHGNRWIFAICVGLMSLALLCIWRFHYLSRNDSDFREQPLLVESEHYYNIF